MLIYETRVKHWPIERLKFERDPLGFNDRPCPCDECRRQRALGPTGKMPGPPAPMQCVPAIGPGTTIGQMVTFIPLGQPIPIGGPFQNSEFRIQNSDADLPRELRGPEPDEVAACTPTPVPPVAEYDVHGASQGSFPPPPERTLLDELRDIAAAVLEWPRRMFRRRPPSAAD